MIRGNYHFRFGPVIGQASVPLAHCIRPLTDPIDFESPLWYNPGKQMGMSNKPAGSGGFNNGGHTNNRCG